MSKKCLVTGGSGFIGRNLCDRLLHEGYEVIALDNNASGLYSNIDKLLDNASFQFIEHDVVNVYDYDVDFIYNLACPASPPFYQKDPIKTTKTCFFGALNALDMAKKYNIPVLQASTSEVYGEPTVHPQIESYRGNVNPIGIRSCYDEGKRIAESLFFDYQRMYGVNIKVIRIFNTYGPFMRHDDGRVISNFICQALQDKPITIYGDGTQTRSFCYIDDLIDGIMSMMNTDSSFHGPVNLGNPTEITVGAVAQIIIDLTGSHSEIEYCALPSDDPTQRKPDITLAKEKLEWSPKIDLKNGLKKTIDYFKTIVRELI